MHSHIYILKHYTIINKFKRFYKMLIQFNSMMFIQARGPTWLGFRKYRD